MLSGSSSDRLEVCWVPAAGDWLGVRWLVGGDWLEVCWVAGEGDWLEVRWVEGAEFGSSWPKALVSSLFWVDKMWIDASGTDTELLWSPISPFLMILVEITDSSSATNFVSESFIIFSMSPSSSLSIESSNAKISPLDSLSILTYVFLALSMSLCVIIFTYFFLRTFPRYHVHIQYHSQKCFEFSQWYSVLSNFRYSFSAWY